MSGPFEGPNELAVIAHVLHQKEHIDGVEPRMCPRGRQAPYDFDVKWRLVTFGGGSHRYIEAAGRLAREGRIPEIAEARIETQHSLQAIHRPFWRQHGEFIMSNPRLFGFAIWKPRIIGFHLDTLPAGWGLIYLDAGCVLNSTARARQRLSAYQGHAEGHGVWATCLDRPRWRTATFLEKSWTKEDLLFHVGASDEVRDSPQWQSGMMLLTPTHEVRDLIQEWEQLSIMRDYHFSADSPSVRANDTTFVEHRHDQSIFSVLAKSKGFQAVGDETWFAPHWFQEGKDFPIWAARWRRGARMTRMHPAYIYRSLTSSREG